MPYSMVSAAAQRRAQACRLMDAEGMVHFAESILLNEERAAAIMESESFQTFFDRSTRLVERALNQPYDFAVDYAGGDDQAGYMVFVLESGVRHIRTSLCASKRSMFAATYGLKGFESHYVFCFGNVAWVIESAGGRILVLIPSPSHPSFPFTLGMVSGAVSWS